MTAVKEDAEKPPVKKKLPKLRLTEEEKAKARAEARTRSADWSFD